MTKFKSKEPAGKTPEEIYRQYQALRDDIPATTYASIKAATEQAAHEDNIELILQRAKTFQPNNIASATSSEQKSFFNRLKHAVFGDNTQSRGAWGTAFASVALAAIAIPFALNFSGQGSRDEQLAYFDDCINCLNYIENAAVSTRGVVPGLAKPNPSQRFDARLGQIFADLKILQSINAESPNNVGIQVKRLKALPSNFYGADLAIELSKPSITGANLVLAIQNDQALKSSSQVFLASESLEIANITARRARAEQNDRNVDSSFAQALMQFEQAVESVQLEQNTLAQNTLAELKKFNTQRDSLNEPAQLEKLISIYTQALQSLGI